LFGCLERAVRRGAVGPTAAAVVAAAAAGAENSDAANEGVGEG